MAVPILEEFRVPALFLISSENLLSGQPYWFDRVIVPVQCARMTRLDLRELGLRNYRFRAGPPARRWDDIDHLLTDIKRVGDPNTPQVESVIAQVDRLSAGAVNADTYYRPMSISELGEMARSPYCHFGSHGHRHEILTRLHHGALIEALSHSKETLESVIGKPVQDLAYPNGEHDDAVVMAAHQTGHERAFVTTPRVFLPGADRLRIPRLLVGGYDSCGRLADRLGGILFSRSSGTPGKGPMPTRMGLEP